MGAEVEIPTVDGNVFMKIPKGISSGQRMKLAGRGVKSAKLGTAGDQFVEIQIKVPKIPDEQYLEAAEKLKLNVFNPRN